MKQAITGLLLAFLVTHCGSQNSQIIPTSQIKGSSASALLTVTYSESTPWNKALTFTLQNGIESTVFDCKLKGFYSNGEKSMYAGDGWDVNDPAYSSGGEHYTYDIASCRNAEYEALIWDGDERKYTMNVPDLFSSEYYKPAKDPLHIRYQHVSKKDPTYFKCDQKLDTQRSNEVNGKADVKVVSTCASIPGSKITKSMLGPLSFIENPGPWAHVAAYEVWSLPSVVSNAKNYAMAREKLNKQVAVGQYTGYMTTKANGCSLSVTEKDGVFTVEHKPANGSVRRVEFTAATITGFIEGNLYKEPTHIDGEPVGTFAAVEFPDPKKPGQAMVLKFEDSPKLGKAVRINGKEAYCRALQK